MDLIHSARPTPACCRINSCCSSAAAVGRRLGSFWRHCATKSLKGSEYLGRPVLRLSRELSNGAGPLTMRCMMSQKPKRVRFTWGAGKRRSWIDWAEPGRWSSAAPAAEEGECPPPEAAEELMA